MIIYHYDRHTGEFLGDALADPSPAETGAFLLPAFSTPIVPPGSQEGYVRCFVNGAWIFVEDHRGQTIYSTDTASPMIVGILGPIPGGYTDLIPCTDPMWGGTEWIIDPAKQQKRIVDVVQVHMDVKARAYGYDHILSATSYDTSTNEKFQTEGKAFKQWRDDIWTYCLTVLKNTAEKISKISSEEELISSLPPFPLDT